MIEMEIPKDIMAVETTFVGPFSMRQTICFGVTSIIEYWYYSAISSIGLELTMDNLIGLGVLLALPILAFSLVKPYGLPLEQYLANVFVLSYLAPKVRIYQIHSIFTEIEIEPLKPKKYSTAEMKRHPEYIMYL